VTYRTAFVLALCGCDAGRHERSDNPSQANDRNAADILADNPMSSSRSAKYSLRKTGRPVTVKLNM
jgi:hypothetical protein